MITSERTVASKSFVFMVVKTAYLGRGILNQQIER
jgi:hypothetical protein